jgi:hypothetical protein
MTVYKFLYTTAILSSLSLMVSLSSAKADPGATLGSGVIGVAGAANKIVNPCLNCDVYYDPNTMSCEAKCVLKGTETVVGNVGTANIGDISASVCQRLGLYFINNYLSKDYPPKKLCNAPKLYDYTTGGVIANPTSAANPVGVPLP